MIVFMKKKGVTLIELIVAIGILAVVLSAIYGFNIFGIKTFSMGEAQSNLQSDVRTMSAMITRDVRYASEIKLSNKAPASGDGYSYIRTEGSSVKFYENGKLKSSFPSSSSPGLEYDVDFTGSTGNLLIFKITAKDNNKGKVYSIDSKVLCENIVDGKSIDTTSGVVDKITFK